MGTKEYLIENLSTSITKSTKELGVSDTIYNEDFFPFMINIPFFNEVDINFILAFITLHVVQLSFSYLGKY